MKSASRGVGRVKKVINLGISAFGPVSVDLTGSMSRKVGAMGKNTRTW